MEKQECLEEESKKEEEEKGFEIVARRARASSLSSDGFAGNGGAAEYRLS